MTEMDLLCFHASTHPLIRTDTFELSYEHVRRLTFGLVTMNKFDGTTFTFPITKKEKSAFLRAALFGGNPDPRPKKRVGIPLHFLE